MSCCLASVTAPILLGVPLTADLYIERPSGHGRLKWGHACCHLECELHPNAGGKRARKGCDWIVANDVRPETGVMGGDVNQVHLVTADGIEHWPLMAKTDVAARLADRIAATLI